MKLRHSDDKELSPWAALAHMWDLLVAIAVPVAGLAVLGRWLDEKYQATPWFSLVCVAFGLFISGMITKRKAEEIKKRFIDTKT